MGAHDWQIEPSAPIGAADCRPDAAFGREDHDLNLQEAVAFLGPAIGSTTASWADLGAGRGVFTQALAAILDEDATILAVDKDDGALRELRRLANRIRPEGRITVTKGDLEEPRAIRKLEEMRPAGVLLSNVLHYVTEPGGVLRELAQLIMPGGRIVVIEYDRNRANRWVPHPLPLDRMSDVAAAAGLTMSGVLSRRPSAYQGDMYSVSLSRTDR